MAKGNHGRGDRQCTATVKKTGARCNKAPILGGTVCRYHGGGAPQVKACARERLLALVDPALAELTKLLRKAKMEPVRLAAVKDVLDRCGYKIAERTELTGADGGPIQFEHDVAPALSEYLVSLRAWRGAVDPHKGDMVLDGAGDANLAGG